MRLWPREKKVHIAKVGSVECPRDGKWSQGCPRLMRHALFPRVQRIGVLLAGDDGSGAEVVEGSRGALGDGTTRHGERDGCEGARAGSGGHANARIFCFAASGAAALKFATACL